MRPLGTTAEARKRFMEEHKLRLPRIPAEPGKPRPVSLLTLLERKERIN